MLSIGPVLTVPALFTKMSALPKVDLIFSNSFSTEPSSMILVGTERTWTWSLILRISCSVSRSWSALRATRTIALALAFAKAAAKAYSSHQLSARCVSTRSLTKIDQYGYSLCAQALYWHQ